MIKNVDIQQYIDVKNVAYKFYGHFSKFNRNSKIEFVDYVRTNEDIPEFLKEVVITTLFYPNDYYLLAREGNNNLVKDIDILVNDIKIDKDLLNSKRKEFQFMNYSKLLSDGKFENIDFNKFPLTSDSIYQEYLINKAKISGNEKKSK